MLYAHLHEPPPSLKAVRCELPEELDAVIAKAMAKDPSLRFPSAGDLGRAAAQALERRPATVPERSVATGEAAPAADRTRVSPPDSEATPPGVTRRRGERVRAAQQAPAIGASAASTTPDRTRARRTAWIISATAAVLVAGVAVVVLVSSSGGRRSRSVSRSPAVPRIVGRPITLSRYANALGVAYGSVWIAHGLDGTITRLASSSGKVLATIRLPPRADPLSVDTGGGKVWVDAFTNQVIIIDPRNDHFSVAHLPPDTSTLKGPGFKTFRFSFGDGAMWILSPASDAVTRVDPSTAKTSTPLRVGPHPIDIAVGGGSLYVLYEDGTVSEFIDTDGSFARKLKLRATPGARPESLSLQAGALMLGETARNGDVELVPYDIESAHTGQPLDFGPAAESGGIADGKLWVAYSAQRTLTRWDLSSRKMVGPSFALPDAPWALDSDASNVWVLIGVADGRPAVVHVKT